jgi:hypothetical protein
MPWNNVASCDVCGAIKRESNHWLLVSEGYTPDAVPTFRIFHWNDAIAKQYGIRIACGEQCLGALLQPFLSRRTIPATEESTV